MCVVVTRVSASVCAYTLGTPCSPTNHPFLLLLLHPLQPIANFVSKHDVQLVWGPAKNLISFSLTKPFLRHRTDQLLVPEPTRNSWPTAQHGTAPEGCGKIDNEPESSRNIFRLGFVVLGSTQKWLPGMTAVRGDGFWTESPPPNLLEKILRFTPAT